jgi:hypothetical protein
MIGLFNHANCFYAISPEPNFFFFSRMELKGSCHCEKVTFKVLSHTPAPVSIPLIILKQQVTNCSFSCTRRSLTSLFSAVYVVLLVNLNL